MGLLPPRVVRMICCICGHFYLQNNNFRNQNYTL
jgi:hypothetical protein